MYWGYIDVSGTKIVKIYSEAVVIQYILIKNDDPYAIFQYHVRQLLWGLSKIGQIFTKWFFRKWPSSIFLLFKKTTLLRIIKFSNFQSQRLLISKNLLDYHWLTQRCWKKQLMQIYGQNVDTSTGCTKYIFQYENGLSFLIIFFLKNPEEGPKQQDVNLVGQLFSSKFSILFNFEKLFSINMPNFLQLSTFLPQKILMSPLRMTILMWK